MIQDKELSDPNYLHSTRSYWTSKEVCHYLAISTSQLKRLIREGTIKPFKIGNNLRGQNKFLAEDIKQLITTNF